MLVVLVTLHVRPDRLKRFERAIELNAAASVRAEPGRVQFTVSRSETDTLEFMLYERYVDAEAFGVHRVSSHFKEWRAEAAACLVPDTQVTHRFWQTFDAGSVEPSGDRP